MASSRSPDDHINLLRELGIPGRTKDPISTSPDVWGLNIAAVLDNFPRHGLQCTAGPWGVMGRGDRLVIFWGLGNQVLLKTVTASEVGTELQIFVEARHILAGNFDVSYDVTRLGQTAEPSEVMKVFVKLTRPGGKDDNDEPGHSKLIMHIPREILEGGIDKDNVAAGVDITIEPYPNIAPGDVIRLSWGGVFVFSPPLTQDQADGKTPIVIHVDEATIRSAGDSDSTGLAVVFELYDKVDNRSEDWSAAQRVVVSIDTARPLAPLLKETQNNVLDLDKLGDAKGTGQVLAVDGKFFAKGDTVFLKLKGTPVEGTPIDHELPGKVLESVPSILEIPIDNALLRRFAKAQMVLSYRIQKADGSADIFSKGQFISVIGQLQRLKPPIAEDAEQGALDPDLPLTRIEIPWDASFEAGQAIKLFWLGTLPDLTPYLPDLPLRPITNGDISAGLPLYITVDGVHIKTLEGGTLELYYQLLSDDGVLAKLDRYSALNAIRESEHAALLAVGEPRLELPMPTVEGVVDNVLDPDRNGTTLTATWLNTLVDDKVTREWEGSKTGLDSDSITLTSFTAGKEVPFPISAALIKGNEGGTVQARYFVERAGERTRHSQPLDFNVGAALELKPPKIRQAEPDGKTLLPMNAVEALTAVVPPEGLLLTDLLSVTWAAAAGSHAEGSHTTEARPISETGLNIALPVTVLAFNLGKTASVTFTITRDGKPVTSLPLSLNVGTLPVNVLPKPVIPAADNDGEGPEFNVSNLTANTVSRIGVWPLISAGQRAWMRLKGTKADDSEYLFDIAPGSAVSQQWIDNGFQNRGLTAGSLRALKDGSTLSIECKATLNKSTNESEAVVFPVRTYTIKAFEVVTPTITKAEDSKREEIPQGGTTVDTTVKLTGTGSKGQKVLIKDGNTDKGEATVNLTTGLWELIVMGLSVAAHSFTATALYGSGPVSAARTLTVTADTAPTITQAEDSKGAAIPQGGTTVDTTVKLSGAGAKGQKVQIKDGTTVKGETTVNLTTSLWELTMMDLSVAAHSFTVIALYGSGQVSAARTLTVTANTAPTITQAADSKGVAIAQGGFTVDTTVKLSGAGAKGQKVQIKDGTTVKGETTVNLTTGLWELTMTGLSVAAHSFTATALYGSGQVSTARTLTVTASTAPTITQAADSKGVAIAQGGFTVDTTVKLSGAGAKGQKVQIKDGTTVKGEATVNLTTGLWELTMTGLSVAAHSFTATALYGSGQVSTARTLTVTANTATTITSVKDQSDWVIPDNGYTVHTSVTLTGSASAGQEVEVFLDTTSKGKAKARTDSIWTYTVSGLTLNVLHTIKAIGQYANNPTSNLWRLTALNGVVPAITAAHDSKGQPIANGGSTIDTTVRLTGTANTFLEVEIFDDTASTGKKAKANDQRVWTVDLTGLTIDDHSFKAKALYGSGTESAPRTLTVAADTAPTITSAKGSPSGVEIREGAPTLETAVILTGTANKGQQVEVFNNNVSKGTPTADATTGIWTLPVSGLSVTAHSFTAKALYGSGQTSAPRTFRVVNERLLDNFDSYPEQFTGLGNPLRLPTMTITSSTTYIGITPFNFASGIMERQVLFIHNSTIARIALISEYSHVKFSMLCYSKTILTFYNSNGTCLGEHRPPHGDGASFPPPSWVEFNAPGGHKISYIEVDQTAGGTQVGYIDYFYVAS